MNNGLAKIARAELALPGFRLEKIGLVPDTGVTFEQWEVAIKSLGEIGSACHWWIGDALNFGEDFYKEKYQKVLENTGFDYQTLANDKWVSRKVDFSLRREKLSFGHHKCVARFSPEEQKNLLGMAEKNVWSLRELREFIRGEKPHEFSFPDEADAIYQWLVKRREAWPEGWGDRFFEVVRNQLAILESLKDVERRLGTGATESGDRGTLPDGHD